MKKGFKATLFAGCFTLSAFAPAFAAAPVISGLPDITVGDLEDSSSSDSNLFVFSDAFQFSAYVSDDVTPDALLKWSFAEFSDAVVPTSRYQINGVGPIAVGTTAIATQEGAGNPLAQAAVSAATGRINDGTDFANIRDIVFSPTSGSAPYPDPSPSAAAEAALGKVVRFYVADADNGVAFQDTIIKTLDDSSDFATDTQSYEEQVRDSGFATGWVRTGSDYPGVSTSNATAGQLDITVTPTSGKYRIQGWKNDNLLPYNEVGAAKFVRGKFFIKTSNVYPSAPGAYNQVPGFRVRITNEGAVNAAIHYEYGTTGYTDPGYEPFYGTTNDPVAETFASFVRPTNSSTVPSLYRVDLDPVDVPAAAGSNIGALMESYAVPNPANGTLSLMEVVLGTYDAKTDADSDATLIFDYTKTAGLSAGAGGPKAMQGGGFNAEADFQPGRRQNLTLPTSANQNGFFQMFDQGAAGLVGDTNTVAQTVFGVGLLNVVQTDAAQRVRIEPNKLYRTRFYATSSVPTDAEGSVESQGNIRFRFQTISNSVSYLLDMSTVAGFSLGTTGDAIATQALPGIGSENPDVDAALTPAGEDGGWYSVIAASPLDTDGIRENEADNFGTLALAPGPGSALASPRDVQVGVDLIQIPNTLRLAPPVKKGPTGVVPFGRPNRAQVRLSAVKVYEYPSIDDGGYDY